MDRPRSDEDHVRGERSFAASERRCLFKQEGKMAVRGPEKWSCKLSDVLLRGLLECTRKSDGTAGHGVWKPAGQEESLNLLLRTNEGQGA